MNKKKTLLLTTIMISFGILFGCSKNDNVTNFNTKESTVVTEDPFATIGEYHNQFLQDIGIQYRETIESLPLSQPIDSVGENLINNILNYTVARLSSDIENADTLVYTSNRYFISAIEEFEDEPLLAELLDKSESIDELLYLINSEKKILINNLSSKEDTSLLLSLTIFEYSIQYWDNAYNDKDNPWHNLIVSMEQQLDTKGSWNLYKKILSWYKANKQQLRNAAVSGGLFDYIAAKAIVEHFPAVLAHPWILGAIIGVSSAAGVLAGWFGC